MIIVRSKNSEVFQAKYESTCYICTKGIVVGDQARYLDGRIRHHRCKEGSPNLYYKQNRKKINKSFINKREETCTSCHKVIKVGETARFSPDGEIRHARHTKTKKVEEICQKCYLVMPCSCE